MLPSPARLLRNDHQVPKAIPRIGLRYSTDHRSPIVRSRPCTQLTISLALPLVVQAAWEAGLYKQHQSQRLTQGLSKECGWQARLYAWIGDVLVTCDALALLAAGWVLVGILWHLAVSLNAAPI